MKKSKLKKHIREVIKETHIRKSLKEQAIGTGAIPDYFNSQLQFCMDPCATNSIIGSLPNMLHDTGQALSLSEGNTYWFQNGDCSGGLFGFPDETQENGSSLYNPTNYLAWINWWDNAGQAALDAGFCANETGESVFGANTFGVNITMQQFSQYLQLSNLDVSCCTYPEGWLDNDNEEEEEEATILGCMNPYADNYNPEATEPDPAVTCCSETGAGGLPTCTGGGYPIPDDDDSSNYWDAVPMKEPSKDIPNRVTNKRRRPLRR